MSSAKTLAAGDVIFSLKTFTAAMLAYGIALYFGLEQPFWSMGTAYIVAHPLSGATTSKAVYRLAGTLLGATATVVLVPNLIPSRELLALGMALWTGACLFVSMLDRTPRSYVFMLAGYTAVLVGTPLVDNPQATFDTAIARVQEILVGILCVALVGRAFWPQRTGAVLSHRVDGWLDNVAGLMRDVLAGAGNGERAMRARQALAADAVDLRSFTTHVGYETRDDRILAERMTSLQERMVALLPLLSEITDIVTALDRSEGGRGAEGQWLEDVSVWIDAYRAEAPGDAEYLLAEFARAQQIQGPAANWRSLISVRLAKRLYDLVNVWRDCHDLRSDMAVGTVHALHLKRRSAGQQRLVSLHTDYGMAALSAFAVVVAILLACALWVGSAWPYGGYAVQMASILCCVLATMDDAIPTLRKVLWMVIAALGVAFLYQFGILPMVDGFFPLVFALGLFLIPVGVLLATPARWLLGFQLSVNLVYMLQLHDRPSLDFIAFINTGLATVIGVIIAMMSLSTIRSVGAEASVRRLLHAGWGMIIEAAKPRPSGVGEIMMHRMLDQVGLLVPRLAAIPSGSELRGVDVLRDLRVGLSILKIQRNKMALPAVHREALERLLTQVVEYYHAKRRGWPSTFGTLLDEVDACFAQMLDAADSIEAQRIRDALVGLRTALSPDTLEVASA
ncbi:FUSC family protein [Pseudomonas fluorescens]|uniref:FUSC family protein n=1 Tax=Pseudomonas fluorescens TaxID=294 RepID=UPI0017836229|nr:FUSC family protein [Pseudomonas fluorescens]